MADELLDVDELGPVDWMVVEFPGSTFNGEIAPELQALVERGIVRVLDLLVLKRTTTVRSTRSRSRISTTARPASSARSNTSSRTCSARMTLRTSRTRSSPDRLQRCSSGKTAGLRRSPAHAAAPAASSLPTGASRSKHDVPLAARRMRREAVLGPAPVARTAATVGTAVVVAHGVNRRMDRREDRRDRRI
jgi:hypothetical protein